MSLGVDFAEDDIASTNNHFSEVFSAACIREMIQFWTAVLHEDTMRRSASDTGTAYSHCALKWGRRNCDNREYSRLVLATRRLVLKLLLYKCLIHMMMSHVRLYLRDSMLFNNGRLSITQWLLGIATLRAGGLDAVFFFNDKCGRYAKYSTFPPYFNTCILNPVGLPDSWKTVINYDNLQSSFHINLALDYQPRHGLTASSEDFHWVGSSVRESNQSAVEHLSLHAGSRDASSDRLYAEKLGHRARKRMACNRCVFSNA
ncbi:hypothetical protein ALC62_02728 [Cyphomyrmex costatus]|uniref:Uncharacterized protein n=1 Tax=Cyphomyrmex costatus TaxID=456900 RepID=A0A195D0E7_9HYME|nr:hypothetical protein ALC62_02728 [Cyphomyrmex costatus]